MCIMFDTLLSPTVYVPMDVFFADFVVALL